MGDAKEILFVCTCGVDRSPTAADVFNKHFKAEGLDYIATSRGAIAADHSEDPLADMVARADRVVAVSGWIAGLISGWFPDAAGKMRQLEVPDEYARNDPYLLTTFEEFYQSGQWK
ncbi:hypothetical protein KY360_05740 [Candidatus Woesearchaeota archaeon]|nr:hypothetical protein [Candidatus Woesearchaeota archaeon]